MTFLQATQLIAQSTANGASGGSGGSVDLASAGFWAIAILWLVAWVVLFVICRIWEGRKVLGPSRFDPLTSAWSLAAVALAGFATFILIPNFYSAYRLSQQMKASQAAPTKITINETGTPEITPRTGTTAPSSASHAATQSATQAASQPVLTFSQTEQVVMGALEDGGAFLVMILLHLLVRPRELQDLGLAGKEHGRLLRGILSGLVGFILLLPVIEVVGIFVEEIYQRVHFQHPNAHELLLTLGGTSNRALQILIVFQAVVLAPLFEEFFFRAHLQTLLLRLLSFRSVWQARLQRAGRMPAANVEPYNAPALSAAAASVLPYRGANIALKSGLAERWGAILITSLLFAMVHTTWERPQIFVLALCLGYAYERTGNLWTTITMHACFNGIMVFFFLYGMG